MKFSQLARSTVAVLVVLLVFGPGIRYAGAQSIEQEITFATRIPTTAADRSRVEITGEIDGDPIEIIWDFESIGRGPLTNGAIEVTQSSSRSVPAVSIQINSGYGGIYMQQTGEWYASLYLGNFSPEDRVFNAKETFAIPDAPYSLVTLRRGPGGREYRHREYNANNLTCAVVETAEWNATTGTLRLTASLRSEWDGEGWIQADFSVLLGGSDDRNGSSNRGTLQRVFGE